MGDKCVCMCVYKCLGKADDLSLIFLWEALGRDSSVQHGEEGEGGSVRGGRRNGGRGGACVCLEQGGGEGRENDVGGERERGVCAYIWKCCEDWSEMEEGEARAYCPHGGRSL